MDQVLALETTTDVCSVAVNIGTDIVCHSIVAPRKHNKLLLNFIAELLDSNEIKRADLDLIAFSAGPGSFTGVRLGASVAQGIALALGLNVVVVPTSNAMALQVRKLHPDLQNFNLVRWSRNDWFYVSRYCWQDASLECTQRDELVEECDLPTGGGVIRNHQITLSAREVIEIAHMREIQSVAPESALPLYVEGDSPYQVRTNP